MKNLIKFFLVLSLVVTFASSVNAQLYGESVGVGDLSDSRNMTVLDGSWTGFWISWNISETSAGSGLWDYSYTVGNGHDISNFILETSTDTTISNFNVSGPYTKTGPQNFSKSGSVNLPADIFGIKVETSDINPVTYSFQTTSDPVWGNFHAKDGKDGSTQIEAYNAALDFAGFTSNNTNDFIVRPNGGSNPPVVPEPVSSTLFLVGAVTLGFRRFRKK